MPNSNTLTPLKSEKTEILGLADCEKAIREMELVGDCLLFEQTGGLFNNLIRIEVGAERYYFKQYREGSVNSVFSPPEIPASERFELAYDVQILAQNSCRINGVEGGVPSILYKLDDKNAFVMEEANGTKPLIEYLSRYDLPALAITRLPLILGALHAETMGRFNDEPLYQNKIFNDYKLRIQYDEMAKKMNRNQSAAVMSCKEIYQKRAVCLVHGDINSRNIMVDQNSLGVIDFEQAHIGAPEYDLAYILCELVISLTKNGFDKEIVSTITRFLDAYFSIFDNKMREEIEQLMTHHLAVQIIYRFWGPSRKSWTFYVEQGHADYVLKLACEWLLREGTVTDVLKAYVS